MDGWLAGCMYGGWMGGWMDKWMDRSGSLMPINGHLTCS